MYPVDRRKCALNIYSLLHSLRKTAVLVMVSHTTVARWLKEQQPKKYKQRVSTKTSQVVSILKTSLELNPTITLSQLKDTVKNVLAIDVLKEILRTCIHREGYTLKNVRFYGKPSGLDLKVSTFITKRDKFKEEGRKFVSIDETSFGRNTRHVKGYSQRGTRIYIRKRQPRVTTTSVIACLDENGVVATCKHDGSVNTTKFLDFLKNLRIPKGTVVLLDNCTIHHGKVIKMFAEENEIELSGRYQKAL